MDFLKKYEVKLGIPALFLAFLVVAFLLLIFDTIIFPPSSVKAGKVDMAQCGSLPETSRTFKPEEVEEFARNYTATLASHVKSVNHSKGTTLVTVMVFDRKCVVEIDETNGSELLVNSFSCVESK